MSRRIPCGNKKPSVLHLSALHGGHDMRVVYREGFSLAGPYCLTMILTRINPQLHAGIRFEEVPFYSRLWQRLLLVHPRLLIRAFRHPARLIHLHDPEMIPLGLILKAFGRIIVFDFHENLHRQLQAKKINNSIIYRSAFRFFDRLARRYFYLIFAETSYLEEYRNLSKPHVVVLNYPSLSLFEPFQQRTPAPLTEPEFFYLGQLSFARCLDVLIEALARLQPEYPRFKMHLFGPLGFDISHQEALNHVSGYEQVKGNLIFYGTTDARRAFSYTARCVAGVALLKPVGDYPGSYPTKLFEYMALSLPVITSDFPLYKAVVEANRCGFCIDPASVDTLYRTLKVLIEYPQAAREMGEKGRQAVERQYNWASEEENLLNFYEQIFSENKLALPPLGLV